MSETRAAIRRAVEERPGIHFSALRRHLDIAPGQAQHHLRRLQSAGEVVEEALYGQTHYYPTGYDERERRTLALFRRDTARGLLLYLLDEEPARPGEVAAFLDVSASTLSWHLDRLSEAGVVTRTRDGRKVYVELADRETVERLLADVTPSLPDRLIDRFEDLVDSLLSE